MICNVWHVYSYQTEFQVVGTLMLRAFADNTSETCGTVNKFLSEQHNACSGILTVSKIVYVQIV